MRYLQLIILMLFCTFTINAQNKIKAYEYWFDDNYANKVVTTITPVKQFALNTNIATTGLTDGLHSINVRAVDDSSKYTSTISEFFYKVPQHTTLNAKMQAYEYWFDNDYANAVKVTTPAQQQVSISSIISTQPLASGMHAFNIRFKDEAQQWSSTLSEFFYKVPQHAVTASKMQAYEYWFDNDYANAVKVTTPAQQQISISSLISTQPLVSGMHAFNIRFKDEAQQWSSTLSEFFYKVPQHAVTATKMQAYEYWFDNDYANVVKVDTPTQQQASISSLISTQLLASGMHAFNIRFKDDAQQWSSTLSEFFYKVPPHVAVTPTMQAYEYWFDNDYAKAVKVTTPAQQQVTISSLVSTQLLANGVHAFNIRFKDEAHQWSSTLSDFFYKIPEQVITNNTITHYRYWIDNNTKDQYSVALSNPEAKLNLITNLDLTRVSKNEHTISFQFKDSLGNWSSLTTDSFTKQSLPIADFDYVVDYTCDSTVINFTNTSVDGDIYAWDFGGGDTSTLFNEIRTYYQPGLYTITLTVTDTATMVDSTISKSVFIKGHNKHAYSVTNCGSYVSPSGKFTYTASGIYIDTLQNTWGCDSLITINVTINNFPDTAVIKTGVTLTAKVAGVSYQWLDCNNNLAPLTGETNRSFTATVNGNYAVLLNNVGCIDTSSCVSITSVGIISYNYGSRIEAYPNPTNGKLNIELDNEYFETIVTIYTLKGEVVNQQIFNNQQKLEVNIDGASGVYLVNIKPGDKNASIRVVKQ